jgi:hypothetical protein
MNGFRVAAVGHKNEVVEQIKEQFRDVLEKDPVHRQQIGAVQTALNALLDIAPYNGPYGDGLSAFAVASYKKSSYVLGIAAKDAETTSIDDLMDVLPDVEE